MRRLVLLSILFATAGCVASDDSTPAPAADVITAEANEPAPTPTPSEASSGPAPAGNRSAAPTEPANGTANAPEPPSPAPPAPEPRIETVRWTGTVTGVRPTSVDVPDSNGCCRPGYELDGGNTAASFAVSDPPQAILVELAWDDPTFDLDLLLSAPDRAGEFPPSGGTEGIDWGTGGRWLDDSQSPDARARILVDDPAALVLTGDWDWNVSVKAGNGVAFRVVVTVFYDAAPPEGFTAAGA